MVNGKTIGDKHVCAGIYLGVGGMTASPTDKIMIDYLKSQELSDTVKCWTKAGLTPRRIQGSREKITPSCGVKVAMAGGISIVSD